MCRGCALRKPQLAKTTHERRALRFIELHVFKATRNCTAQAFVAQLVQLARPDTPLTQIGKSGKVSCAKKQFVARPDVLLTAGDIYVENQDKIPQQVFAGLQGATILDTQMSAAFLVPTT